MVWEDQGLFFTLLINAIAMVVMIAVGFMLHKSEGNHRILRPRRPQSTMGSFWQFPKSLFTMNEDEVGASVGVEGAIYCLLLKFCAGFMLACCLGSIIIVSICVSDSYLNTFLFESDPNGCHKKSATQDICEADSYFCVWSDATAAPAAFDPSACHSTLVQTCPPSSDRGGGNPVYYHCTPKPREGLFDLSVQNLTPKHWTLWLYAVACLGSGVQMAAVLHYLLGALRNLFNKAYRTPLMIDDDFDEKPGSEADARKKKKQKSQAPSSLNCLPSYPALATVGARTVMVAGFFNVRDEEDVKTLEDGPAAILAKFRSSTLPFGLEGKHRAQAAKEIVDEKLSADDRQKRDDIRKEEAAKKITQDASCQGYADYILPDSIVAVRQPPKKMIKLMAKEAKLLEALTNDVAGEQLEDDLEKNPLPHQKRVPPRLWNKVAAVDYDIEQLEIVRADLRPLVAEVSQQNFVGSVIFTFDTPLHALEFVEAFNKSHGGAVSKRQATIVGPKSGIIWDNLTVAGPAAKVRWTLMMVLLVALTFFWGIPVAFLGSLDKLATLPVIGEVFADFVRALPVTVRGILSAYLPTIVLTVFHMFLPAMLRKFTRVGGVQSTTAEDSTVLSLFFFFTLMTGIVIQAAIQGGLGQLAALIAHPTEKSVFAFILAIVSPSGGYWYSFLITAACLGTFKQLLLLAPLVLSRVFVKAKIVTYQQAYDALFAPRKSDYPIQLAFHLFFFSIAMLFHSTVPFLVPFGLLYFCNAYLVERALLLDGGQQMSSIGVDFTLAKNFLSSVLMVHTVAVSGTLVVSVLKLHIPATVISTLGLALSIGMQVRMRLQLNPLITPSVRLYHHHEEEGGLTIMGGADDDDEKKNQQQQRLVGDSVHEEHSPPPAPGTTITTPAADRRRREEEEEGEGGEEEMPISNSGGVAVVPSFSATSPTIVGPAFVGSLEPTTVNDHGYQPLYSFYAIDEDAVVNIKEKNYAAYAIDLQWYHKHGASANPLPLKEALRKKAMEKANAKSEEPERKPLLGGAF